MTFLDLTLVAKKTKIYNNIKLIFFLIMIITVVTPFNAHSQGDPEEISSEIKLKIAHSIKKIDKKIYKVLVHQEWVNIMVFIIADHSMHASTAKTLSFHAIEIAMKNVGEEIPTEGRQHGKYNYSAGVYFQDQKQVILAQKFRHIPKIMW